MDQNRYFKLSSKFSSLQKQGFIERAQQLVADILQSGIGKDNPKAFTNNLKMIFSTIVDTAFQKEISQSRKPIIKKKRSRASIKKKPTGRSPSVDILSSASKTLNKIRSTCSSLKQPSVELSMAPSNSLNLISDFCYTKGPGKFSKEKRTREKELLPGPTDYNPIVQSTRFRSPKAVISTNKDPRCEFYNPETPSPVSYYPMRHFLSK